MLLAQGRYWRATLPKNSRAVVLQIAKGELPDGLYDLRELKIEVPLSRWNVIVKYVLTDRKLLGGLLLDFARTKDRVADAVSSDRLLAEFQRLVVDATVTLVEEEVLVLEPADGRGDE